MAAEKKPVSKPVPVRVAALLRKAAAKPVARAEKRVVR